MISTLSGRDQQYLTNLGRIQDQMEKAESQLSSGLRVTKPSDDPSVVREIVTLKSQISRNSQMQANLDQVNTELSTADSSLQSAVSLVESALTIAASGANSLATASKRAELANEVAGLQASLVGLSQTVVNGKYIFSGAQDGGPQYQLDSAQPTGVRQLFQTSASSVVVDATGVEIKTSRTAQEIFDARNPDGSVAAGNVFAAVNSLKLALQSNDAAAIASATDALKAASATLNNAGTFYGNAENSVTAAQELAKKFNLQETTSLGQAQDADIAAAAMQLTQAQTAQQAALASESKVIQEKNLFSYLG